MSSQFNNIPQELRDTPAWVVWRYEVKEQGKPPTKVPYNASNGQKANPADVKTGSSFVQAVKMFHQWGMDGIGFIFSPDDPYAVIDLDNKEYNPATPEELERHEIIKQHFNSYTETSPSGTGVHIIIRGSVDRWRNRDHVEVCSAHRFMTMTGNVVNPAPISDYQELLSQLVAEMDVQAEEEGDGSRVKLDDAFEGHLSDAEVVDMAMAAQNGEKFNELCRGDWETMGYPSQSEADFALLSILAFYTRDNEQVRRIFRMSPLGKREKAQKNNKYIDFALGRIRAKEAPPIDMSQLSLQQPSIVTPSSIPESMPDVASDDAPVEEQIPVDLPPGLVGEIAKYVFSTSIRPVMEYSLAAGLALVAGIAGRAYHISNTGLNQYFVILGGTGTGKESMATGIDAIISACRMKVPMIDAFMGPTNFASGQGLNKMLVEKPCFLSIIGEFGHMAKGLLHPRASEAMVALKTALLRIYNNSGPHQMYKGTVYSDRDKNVPAVRAPNVSILAETTPDTFFKVLGEEHAADGFIPRLLLVEYTGGRVPLNPHAGRPPSPELVQMVSDLATISITNQSGNQSTEIQISTAAKNLLMKFNDQVDEVMNSLPEGAVKHILNRSHVKAIKLAGLVAVGINPYQPVIDTEIADWAIKRVNSGDKIIAKRFDNGEIGEGDILFESVIRKAIEYYRTLSYEKKMSIARAPASVVGMPVIPFASIRDYCKRREPFKSHRLGYSKALEIALDDLVKASILVEIPAEKIPVAANGQRPKCYGIGLMW